MLEFQNIVDSANKLNSKVSQFVINLYHADLNEKLLNKYIFKELQFLDLNGEINSIQDDLFKDSSVKILRIRMQNIKKLFMINNNWLQFLNSNVKYDLTKDTKLKDYYDKIFVLILYQSFHRVTF